MGEAQRNPSMFLKEGIYDSDWSAGCKIEFDPKVGIE
jgi:hypothetical protein